MITNCIYAYKSVSRNKSITIAEKMTGIHKGNIARNVRGESKTAGGYVWVKKE